MLNLHVTLDCLKLDEISYYEVIEPIHVGHHRDKRDVSTKYEVICYAMGGCYITTQLSLFRTYRS